MGHLDMSHGRNRNLRRDKNYRYANHRASHRENALPH